MELVTIQEDASEYKASNLYYQVTSYEDLYNAIAEVNANAANTKNEQVVIDLNKIDNPSKLENDNKYIIPLSSNEITINEGVDLVINDYRGGSLISLERDADTHELLTESASLTIAEGAKITLNDTSFEMNIINNGTLVTNGADISPVSGSALVNNGVANITDSRFGVNTDGYGKMRIAPTDVILNVGTMTANGIYASVPYQFKSPEGDAKVTVYGIKNTGKLLIQSASDASKCEDVVFNNMPANTTRYSLGNIGENARTEIRSSYLTNAYNYSGCESILNDAGTLTLGDENNKYGDNGTANEAIKGGNIYTVNNGNIIIHDTEIAEKYNTNIYTYNDIDITDTTTTEGSITVVGDGAKVDCIYTRDASKVQITNGEVGNASDVLTAPDNAPVRVMKTNSENTAYVIDTQTSKYVFKNPADTPLTRVNNDVIEYAFLIKNGVPFYGEKVTSLVITEIHNLAELKEFAKKGGYGKLAANISVNELVTFSAEEFVLLENGPDESDKELTFVDAGAFVVDESVKNGEIYEAIKADNTVTPLTNNGVLKLGADVILNQGSKDAKEIEGGSAINNVGDLELTWNYRYSCDANNYADEFRDIYIVTNAKKSAAINNSGILRNDELETTCDKEANITASAVGTSAIINSGDLNFGVKQWGYIRIHVYYEGSTGIYNSGSVKLRHLASVEAHADASYSTTGIYNTGTLEVDGGTVKVDNASKWDHDSDASTPEIYRTDGWGIVYENDKMPVINSGSINGSRGGVRYPEMLIIPTLVENTEYEDVKNRVYGSAIVAFDGTNYSIGSYLYGPEKTVVDTKAASYISDGVVKQNIAVNPYNDYDYLLMERGEIVQNFDLFSIYRDFVSTQCSFGCTEDSLWDITANNNLVTIGKTKKKDIDASYTGAEGE